MTLGAGMVAAGCAGTAAEPTPPLAELIGTTWRAETIAGRPVMDNAASTLTFVSAEKIAGLAGCNRYSGPLRVEGGRVRVGPLAATRMACAPALMDQEARFLATLQRVERIARDRSFLLLRSTGDGEPTRLAGFTEPANPPR
jgi:heat shock protein HslJ